MECDLCLKKFESLCQIDFKEIYQPIYRKEKGNQFYMKNEVELREMIMDNVILAEPLKCICSADCRGLCNGCGKDLNTENCICDE